MAIPVTAFFARRVSKRSIAYAAVGDFERATPTHFVYIAAVAVASSSSAGTHLTAVTG